MIVFFLFLRQPGSSSTLVIPCVTKFHKCIGRVFESELALDLAIAGDLNPTNNPYLELIPPPAEGGRASTGRTSVLHMHLLGHITNPPGMYGTPQEVLYTLLWPASLRPRSGAIRHPPG